MSRASSRSQRHSPTVRGLYTHSKHCNAGVTHTHAHEQTTALA
jgi:hypothetical protein